MLVGNAENNILLNAREVIVSKILISILAGSTLLAAGGAASAQDTNFNDHFEGFYAGVLTGFAPALNNNRYQVGVLGGYRRIFSNQFVVGAELQIALGLDTFSSQYTDVSASGQAGVIVGNNVLFYAKAGLGVEKYISISSPIQYVPLFGVGTELAVNDYVNLRFEAIVELNNPSIPIYLVHGAEFNFGVITNFK